MRSRCLRRRGCRRDQSSEQNGEAGKRSSDQDALQELLTPFALFRSCRARINRLADAGHQGRVKRIKGYRSSSGGLPTIRSGYVYAKKLSELGNAQPQGLAQILNFFTRHVAYAKLKSIIGSGYCNPHSCQEFRPWQPPAARSKTK